MKTIQFISIDWGTSNLRIRLVDTTNFNIIKEFNSSDGLKTLHTIWNDQKEERQTFFLEYLYNKIEKFANAETPIIISGMASSSIGLKELPYTKCPFNLLSPKNLTKEKLSFRGLSFYLLSGLQTETDIMRGEEVQLIGLYQKSDVDTKTTFILPGTHSKHIFCEHGFVRGFKTYMTGEFFEIITKHSILKASVEDSEVDKDKLISFKKGVLNSLEKPFLNLMFQIRVKSLFNQQTTKENFYFLSGLLIGEELKTLKNLTTQKIVLCASNSLFSLYHEAIKTLELENITTLINQETVNLSAMKGQYKVIIE